MIKRTTHIEVLVFWLCIWAFSLWAVYTYAVAQGAKQCRPEKNEQVISRTGDTCTYATSYGRATRKGRV